MNRRAARLVPILVLVLGDLPALAVDAQQGQKIAGIGVLRSARTGTSQVGAFRERMRQVEDKNLVIEDPVDDGGSRVRDPASDLVRVRVDVIVTIRPDGIRALQHATTTIPIVMALIEAAGAKIRARDGALGLATDASAVS